jgi:hypothetical protein
MIFNCKNYYTMKNYYAILNASFLLTNFTINSKKILLVSGFFFFLQASAQENSVSNEISDEKIQIQQINSEKLVSKILVLENEIKIGLEKQNKKFTSVTTFYSGLELEKIQSKLPHFTAESYRVLNKELVITFSKAHPDETRMYLDILISELTKINKK